MNFFNVISSAPSTRQKRFYYEFIVSMFWFFPAITENKKATTETCNCFLSFKSPGIFIPKADICLQLLSESDSFLPPRLKAQWIWHSQWLVEHFLPLPTPR